MSTPTPLLFRRRIAVPGDHGTWALFLGPLVIGMVAGGQVRLATSYLVVAAGAGFMSRQPILALAKVRAGRRPASDVPAALFWLAVYLLIGGLHVIGLTLRGYGYVLYLALPALPVFAWYVVLVLRRAERRQLAVQVLATGAFSLCAPAAMWIGQGAYTSQGWLLWLLVWTGFASAIFYAYLRLDQRRWSAPRSRREQLQAGRSAVALAGGGVLLVAAFAVAGVVSAWLLVPFALQLIESIRGSLNPAVGWRPRRIGMHQLTISVLFTAMFALTWSH